MTDETIRQPIGDKPSEARLIYGVDVRTGLGMLSANSVQCVATSPPYWGLRSYIPESDPLKSLELGGEDSPEAYVEALVSLLGDLKRVLRKDGVLWLNLGDTYLGGGRAGNNPEYWAKHKSFGKLDATAASGAYGRPIPVPPGYKPKDLAGVPWKAAEALRRDGWYLRAICPWIKQSVMPESVTDRPAVATEYIFLLAHPESGGKYFYDSTAVRVGGTRNRRNTDWWLESSGMITDPEGDPLAFVVSPKGYEGAHFATWPEALVEPMVASSSMPGQVILDPFSGSGTTGKVALSMGRNYVGLDLNESYASMAAGRILGEDTLPGEDGGILDLFQD